jgi:DNA polymerase I
MSSKYPLLVTVHKEKMFVVADGIFKELPALELDLIVPAEKGYETLPEDYYFIGLNKYRPDSDNPEFGGCKVNDVVPATKLTIPHTVWTETYGRNLPFSYSEYMYVTKKEELQKYPQTKPLKIMYFDIEVCSDGTGLFPKAERNPIAMIGVKTNQPDAQPIIFEDFDPSAPGLEDSKILEDFIDFVYKYDPDIITSYNGWFFDIPYILKRMSRCALDTDKLLGIDKSLMAFSKNVRSYCSHCANPDNDINNGHFGKRIHYDIFMVDVLRDQKLTGIKNRKMKTLGKFFFKEEADEIVELEDSIENIWKLMGSKEGKATLATYLKSDVNLTEKLSNIYFQSNNISQAEKIGVPLSVMINRRNGTIPTLYLMDEMLKNNMMPTSTNSKIYDFLIKRAENDKNQEKLFQGAYVDLYKRGKIPTKIYKTDFVGLYPSIIRTFNLSYETVNASFELIDEPSNSMENYKFERNGNILKITFEDEILFCRVHVSIDMSKRGLVPIMLDGIINERKAVKKSMKSVPKSSIEYKKLDSEQNFLKIIANSTYGILAQRTGIGYLPVGITITALGRWITRKVICDLNAQSSELLLDNKHEHMW